ncbi:MAG TPA: hypothetical protein VF075_00190 [Pyrinomonadaceae bacterium]
MQPPDQMQQNIELRLRTMRILWFALLMSIVMYYPLTIFVARNRDAQPNSTLFVVLVGIALSTTLFSFLVKSKLIDRAVQLQQVARVQQAYIVALALCEVAALLGLIDYFATGDRYYYVLFIIALLGQLLHFPQREHVISASFKSRSW